PIVRVGRLLARDDRASALVRGGNLVREQHARTVSSDQLVARRADEVARLVVAIDDHPRGGEDQQPDAGVLEHRAKPLLALAQLSLHAHELRDVDADAGEARRPPGGIALDDAAAELPAVGAIFEPDRIYVLPLATGAVEASLHVGDERGLVFRR